MTAAMIDIQNIKKSFENKVILDGVDLKVEKGQSLVIIGGSGSGKSVTLKCVLGLMTPDSGSILVGGDDITKIGAGNRKRVLKKIGMLFQSAALFDSLKVWENVAFGLIQAKGMGRAEARDIAYKKLAMVLMFQPLRLVKA